MICTADFRRLARRARLTFRETTVMELRIGVDPVESYSLDGVRRILKMTTGRVRSIEARALRKMHKIGWSP